MRTMTGGAALELLHVSMPDIRQNDVFYCLTSALPRWLLRLAML